MRQAYEIAAEIADGVKGAKEMTTPYTANGRTDTLRSYIRDLIRKEDWSKRVNLAIDGDVLFVHIKAVSREQRLEELLEKMMLAVEDEQLYDEAMEVLHGD